MAIVWPFQKSQGNIVINHLAFHTMRNLPHCILWGARNEVQVVSRKTNQGCHGAKGALCYDHWAAFRRLDLEASRNWILSNAHARTMGLSSFVSSAWLHISSGVSEPCLWQCGEYNPGFSHLAWGCPCRPNVPISLLPVPIPLVPPRWRSGATGHISDCTACPLEKGGSNAVRAMALLAVQSGLSALCYSCIVF